MKKFHANRLLKLADYLEGVPPKEFCLDKWQSECGSIACAMGHACRIPSFQKAGLRLSYGAPYYDRDGECEPGMESTAKFFALQVIEAYRLFHPSYYPATHRNAKYVARRIRAFVKRASR